MSHNPNSQDEMEEKERKRMYSVWYQMIRRCHMPRAKAFIHYGARGIFVCERWRNSLDNFIADMGKRPTDRHSLDRIDNNGPYAPENCRWATQSEQCANKRDANRVLYDGKIMPIRSVSNILGVHKDTLRLRLRRGSSNPFGCVKPAKRLRRELKIRIVQEFEHGAKATDLAEKYDINRNTIYKLLKWKTKYESKTR